MSYGWKKESAVRNIFYSKASYLIIYILGVLFTPLLSQAQQLAFPGATGFGKYTKGGRGGKVIYVDNLNDDGPGSFRDAVEQSGPRTIVFRVSGTINLVDGLVIKNPYITIAGQTAPGDGILLKGGTIFIQTSEVIIRNIRIRKGADRRGDGIGIEAAGKELYNIILDHCSISWASDENIGINGKNGGLRDVTIQHSILGEGIMDHSMGLLANKKLDGIGPDYISIHNNFFISNHERNPTIGSGITATVINNIVHNWKYKGSEYHSFSKGDIMYNKFKRGQDTRGVHRAIEMSAGSNVYLKGNDLPEGTDVTSGDDSDKSNAPYYDNSVYGFAPMTNMSALETYVLENSGAYPLDEVDVRYVSEYKNGTGKMIYNESEAGGFPSLSGGSAPADSDKDGMSDEWELEQGLNPNSFDANGDIDGDGYTNLEEYLNCLMGECGSNSGSNPDENAAPQISNISNQTIDQDNSTSALAFTVSDDKTNASQLVVTSSSSNKTLVDAAGIELAGTNANRTIRVTPNAGEIGTTTITVRVSDGEKSSSTRFDVIVRSTSGTESFGITSLILINADNGTKIADLSDGVQFSTSQLPTDNLTIEANTFGQEAISVVFDWQGQTNFRTENVAPFTLFGDKDGTYEFQKFGVGSYEIAATAFTQEDGQGNASKTTTIRFGIVEGTTNNTAPTISSIHNQTIDQDNSTPALSFRISDNETNASQLVVTASSSNKTLVNAAGIELAGTNADRTIRVTPNAGEIGTTTITVRVSDGEKSASTRFDVTVKETSTTESFGIASLVLINADNGTKITDLSDGMEFSTSQLPTDNLTIETNTFGQEVNSVVFDWQGQTNFNIENVAPFTLFGDKDGTYEFQKLGVGTYEIAATAFTQEDGQGNASKTTTIRFDIVEGTTNNTAPTISSIHNQTIDQDDSTPALSFRISDNETNASQLVVTASSSNKTLVNAAGIELTGTNADRTIKITPIAGEIGATTITVRVSDGEKSASTRFDVTVKETSTTESFGIASLVLINADNGTRITDLSPGMEFSTNDLPTDNLTIEANTFGQEAISVVFDWQGQTNFKTENVAPFTLFGDKDGTYEFQKMGVGTYEIAATAFTQEDGQGNASKTKVIRFTIVEDNSSAPAEGINVNAGDDFEWNIANGPFEVRARWDDIPDAYVTSIKWTKVSGPSIKMITDDRASLEVSQIQVGTYKFKVYVTDSKGRSGTDDIVVDVVEEAGNNNIHVYAGDDFEWESSNGTLELLARWDNIPDAFITNIRWEKVSGDWVRMEDTDRAKVRIINPKQGTYTFQVTITDSKNRTASDDITVQVNNSITSSLNLTDDLVVRNEIPVQRNYLVTNNQVTMQLSTDKQFFIQLIDLSGHEVYSDDFSGQLKTGSLARGMYIYHVMDEDGNLFQKGFILKN